MQMGQSDYGHINPPLMKIHYKIYLGFSKTLSESLFLHFNMLELNAA